MQITPFALGFGAEVAGFDVQSDGSPEELATLRLAYDERQLLVFRNCGRLSPERQVAVASWFGPVGANRDAEGRAWTVLHNLIHNQEQWDGVLAQAEQHGWSVPYRNVNPLVEACFVDVPELGHYLEYLFARQAGLEFFDSVPRR